MSHCWRKDWNYTTFSHLDLQKKNYSPKKLCIYLGLRTDDDDDDDNHDDDDDQGNPERNIDASSQTSTEATENTESLQSLLNTHRAFTTTKMTGPLW